MNFMTKNASIGVFDSGIGGLTVVKRIKELLPNENVIYFGDTARVPYGSKSNETVIEYALQDAEFLARKNVKLIIAACNTVSSIAIPALRRKFDIPIIGMIEPGAKFAIGNTKNEIIGVIGTYATVNNHAYAESLKSLSENVRVFEKACPLFVPLAEEGLVNHPAAKLIAEDYLLPIKSEGVDSLILGCTHYPLLSGIIREVIGGGVKLVDSGVAASKEVENYLNGRGIRNNSNNIGSIEFYVSDIRTKFKEVAGRFLGKEIEKIHRVEVDELFRM